MPPAGCCGCGAALLAAVILRGRRISVGSKSVNRGGGGASAVRPDSSAERSGGARIKVLVACQAALVCSVRAVPPDTMVAFNFKFASPVPLDVNVSLASLEVNVPPVPLEEEEAVPLLPLQEMQIRFHVFSASGVMPPPGMFTTEVLRAVSGRKTVHVTGRRDGLTRVRVILLGRQGDGLCRRVIVGGDVDHAPSTLVVRLLPPVPSGGDEASEERGLRLPAGTALVDALLLPPACEARDAVGFFLERLLPEPPFPGYDDRQSLSGPIVRRYSLARLTGSADDYFCFDCDDDGRRLHLHLRVPGSFSLGQVAPIEGWDCDLLTVRLLDGTSSLDAMQRKQRDANGRKVIELAFDAARDCGETVRRVMGVLTLLSVCLAAAAGSDNDAVGVGGGDGLWE